MAEKKTGAPREASPGQFAAAPNSRDVNPSALEAGSDLVEDGDKSPQTSIEGSPTAKKRSRFTRWRSGNAASAQINFTHPRGHEKMGDEYLVTFDGPDDPYQPLNWTTRKKATTLLVYASIGLGTASNSAIFESAAREVADIYGVSLEVATLGTSLTLAGFALGPLLWAPFSELYGRKWIILIPYFFCSLFAFACGASKDIQSILITRFFQGLFSSSVLTNFGGVLADIYKPKQRGSALVVFSLTVVGGPLTAPVIGSAITYSYLGWRWVMFIIGILQVTTAVLGMLVISETYAPVLLARKAQKLRHQTGNWALHAKHEEWEASLGELARKYLVRPFKLLTHPICFLMSFYASFVYALIYGSLAAVPIVFEVRRGWTPIVASLPFLALLLGCILGLVGNIFNTKLYVKAVDANDGKAVPEARLYPMMAGSVALTAGLFIFAWTGDSDVTWVAPCVGLFLIGAGFFPIFQASVNYLVDTFLPVAASALATTTCLRSIFAAAFPLFMGPMLDALGIGWGVSLLGFVGVAMLPVPYLFFVFGARIRAMRNPLQL